MIRGFGVQEYDVNVEENRSMYVGGSDVPTILGINAYKTQYELAQEKVGLKENDFKGNEYTSFGNALEPQIRDYINEVNGTSFVVQTYIDEDKSIRSNVDGIDLKEGLLLEIKTHGKNPNLKVYEAQMQLYMAQIGVDVGWLALYERPSNFDIEFDAERLQIKEISRDPEFIQKIYEAIETFWIRCEFLKDNPSMTEHEFMTLGTDIDKTLVKVNQLAPVILQKTKELKILEDEFKSFKEELYEKMTENDIKKIEGLRVVITRVLPSTSTRLDSKRLKLERPSIFEYYQMETKRKGYVRITEKKETK